VRTLVRFASRWACVLSCALAFALSYPALSQVLLGVLQVEPANPRVGDSILVRLFRGSGCLQTAQEFYHIEVSPGLVMVRHEIPLGGAGGEFGPCRESFRLGSLPAGIYRIEFSEETFIRSGVYMFIAAINIGVNGEPAAIPSMTWTNICALILIMVVAGYCCLNARRKWKRL
jgi:hypothetical protein